MARLHFQLEIIIVSGLGCWSIGIVLLRLVSLKLGLRPSFVVYHKSLLFLNLDVGRWDLSLQHWTCKLEAGPSAQLHS